MLRRIDESLGNHIDVTIPDEIEKRGWYSFPDHRTMFAMQVRYAYHYGNIDPTSANELASKSLNFVVRQIRTLPNEDRINIPWISHMKMVEPQSIDNVIYGMGCVIGVDGSLGISKPRDIGHLPPARANLMHSYNDGTNNEGMESLFCSVAIMPKSGESINLDTIVDNIEIRFIDPDGEVRYPYVTPKTQYPLDREYNRTLALEPGNNFMTSNSKFVFIAFGMPLDKAGSWTLESNISRDI